MIPKQIHITYRAGGRLRPLGVSDNDKISGGGVRLPDDRGNPNKRGNRPAEGSDRKWIGPTCNDKISSVNWFHT